VNNEGKKVTSYVIPVVFHILHMYGAENISDQNVYNLMSDLNEDYSATNPDISAVIPLFDTIIGDSEIQFKLAALDPFGNCTNGIEHVYTHETFKGETVSKINQWDRSHYMNIWVVNQPNSGGTIVGILLGYATFPSGTDGSGFWTDGIVLRDWTVTSNDRTLTHEVGHYLGLPHPFNGSEAGDGNCGDDGIADTPSADGSFSTCDLTKAVCPTSAPIIENVQNFMDYSSCAVMFTEGQVVVAKNTLEGIAGQRSVLHQDTTLIDTGVKDLLLPQDPTNPLTVPLCTPVADFYSPDKTVCMLSTVSFSDESWNAIVDSRSWTFQDATPSTSTSSNPSVVFDSPGWKKVTLTATNAAGSDTKEDVNYIFVSPDWPGNYGPTSYDMESTSTYATGTDFFVIQNPEDNYGEFGVVSNYGYNGSKAFKLQTYKDVSNADAYTKDWFYNFRLGGSVDNLITPSMDLRNTSGITVTFKYAYATNATLTADITEELKVYSTRNCGETWSPRILSIDGSSVGSAITGDDIVTAGYASNADFNPTTNTMWKEASFTYTSTSQDRLTRFKFEFTASDVASNLFIDDINVTGLLGVNSAEISDLELMVYPNPTNGEAINVSFYAQDEATEFILRDVQGKVITHEVIEVTNAKVTQALSNTENLPSACYFLEVKTGDYTTTKKVVVL